MQNSFVLGISIGESFAEYSLLKDSKPLAQKRVYLARESLKSSLSQFLKDNPDTSNGKAFVSLQVPRRLLDYHLSGAVAHITTEGFEHWLRLTESDKEVTSKDLLFAVPERTRATGEVETPVCLESLAQITEKLQSLDCKKVCLNFLHSEKNPTNLNQARA